MTIIQHAVWLYHRFPLSDRDIQEVLHQRGMVVRHETLREWAIKFSPLFADGLRQRGSRWLLDEVCTRVDGVRHWLWRAVDEHGFVLDLLLQRHRDTEAAKTFRMRLLAEDAVPDTICTDQLRSSGAAIREMPSLINVDHQQVLSTARCNKLIEHSHGLTRCQERQRTSVLMGAVLLKTTAGIQAEKEDAGIPEPARQNEQPPPTHQNQRVRRNQTNSSEKSVPDMVNGRGRGRLNLRPPLPSTCRRTNEGNTTLGNARHTLHSARRTSTSHRQDNQLKMFYTLRRALRWRLDLAGQPVPVGLLSVSALPGCGDVDASDKEKEGPDRLLIGSVRLIVRLIDGAQGWPEVRATPVPTSRHL